MGNSQNQDTRSTTRLVHGIYTRQHRLALILIATVVGFILLQAITPTPMYALTSGPDSWKETADRNQRGARVDDRQTKPRKTMLESALPPSQPLTMAREKSAPALLTTPLDKIITSPWPLLRGGLSSLASGYKMMRAAATLQPVVNFTVTMVDAPHSVVAGAHITYTITVDHTGQPTDVTVLDTVPANTTFISADVTVGTGWTKTEPAVGGTGDVTFTKAAVSPSDMTTFTIEVAVDVNTANNATITNTVTATSPDAMTPGTATTMTTVQNPVNLQVTLADTPDPVVAGTNITYTITVDHMGPITALNVLDTVPANTTFISADVTVGTGWLKTEPAVGGTGNVTFTKVGVLAGNLATFTIVVKVDANTAHNTVISDTVTVTSLDAPAPVSMMTTTTVQNKADLEVIVTDAPDPVIAGTNITYTVTLTNHGTEAASMVTMTEGMDANTTFVSATVPDASWSVMAPAVGDTGNVVFSKNSVAANAPPAVFTIVVKVKPATPHNTTISSTATAASDTFDPAGGNNMVTATTATINRADLEIVSNIIAFPPPPTPVLAGNTITYIVNFKNNGESPANVVRVTDAIPANTTFQFARVLNGSGWVKEAEPPVGGTGNVIFRKDTVDAQETASFEIKVNVDIATPDGTLVHNMASAAADSPIDQIPNNNSKANDVTVASPCAAQFVIQESASGSAIPIKMLEANAGDDNMLYVKALSILCPWHADTQTNNEWIPKRTITPGPGQDQLTSSPVTFSREENRGSGPRDGKFFIVVNGHNIDDGFPLKQKAYCRYQLTPSEPAPPHFDDTSLRTIDVGALSQDPPCTLAKIDGVTSNHLDYFQELTHTELQIHYRLKVNLGGPRRFTITVVGAGSLRMGDYETTQDGNPDVTTACSYGLSPMNDLQTPASGKSGLFTVTPSMAGCGLTNVTSTNADVVTAEIDNLNPFVIHYEVKPNDRDTPRDAFISVFGPGGSTQDFHVTQLGKLDTPSDCTLVLSTATAQIAAAGSASEAFNVSTAAGCSWLADKNVPWIHLTKSNGTSNGQVTYTVDANTGDASRTGVITVTGQRNSPTVTVTQLGVGATPTCPFTLSEMLASVGSAGTTTGNFAIMIASGCSWTATAAPDKPWIHVSNTTGTGPAVITYTVDTSLANRQGTIMVQSASDSKVYTITQQGSSCTFTFEPKEGVAFVGELAGSFGFSVSTTDAGCTFAPVISPCENPSLAVSGLSVEMKGTEPNKRTVIFKTDDNVTGTPTERCSLIQFGNQAFRVIQAASTKCGGVKDIKIGQIIYGQLSLGECGGTFIKDEYRLTLPSKRGIAITVSSSDYDPVIRLRRESDNSLVMMDDDSAGFRNARIPKLPGKMSLLPLEAGSYIIEVSSFLPNTLRSYALIVTADDTPAPAILGAVQDGDTLIVTGENFAKKAKLFIDDSKTAEGSTKNDKFRPQNALIALKLAGKLHKGPSATACRLVGLRVINPDGRMSDVFVYPFGDCKK